jgi:acetyltransferase-like isoleucine patch superfamily enzyme
MNYTDSKKEVIMRWRVRSMIRFIYLKYCVWKFTCINQFLGFDNALKTLIYIDKMAMIPILRKYGAIIGNNCDIETPLFFHNCISFSQLSIGSNCHIGKNCFFDLRNKIEINNHCTIAMGTYLITHFDPGKTNLGPDYSADSKPIQIKENCFIGANCTVLAGVILEKNTLVGAKSLVNNSSQSSTIIAGNPAQKIKELELN